jgi:hypothetical protein
MIDMIIIFFMRRSCWLFRLKFVCEEDLQEHKMRLELQRGNVDLKVLPQSLFLLLRQ